MSPLVINASKSVHQSTPSNPLCDETDQAFYFILFQGAGASLFVASLLGFYLLIVQLFEAMGFPFHLPVGDLGALWERNVPK